MPRFVHAARVAGPEYPASSAAASGMPMTEGMASSVGSARLSVVGVIGEGPSDDEQTPLIDGHLRVVILLKSGICRVFHDARLRIGLDRDTARHHSLRSARFRIPSTEPAVQVGCNGLSTVLRLSFGLIPTVIRIQTSHSYSDLDCCHPSPQSSY